MSEVPLMPFEQWGKLTWGGCFCETESDPLRSGLAFMVNDFGSWVQGQGSRIQS